MFQKHRKINSYEDGNCAYNAAVLGLVDLILAGKLDANATAGKYNKFLEKFAKALCLEDSTWSNFKRYLLENKDNPILLQQTITPVLRSLVSSIQEEKIKEAKDPAVLQSELYFKAEFEDFAMDAIGLPRDEKKFTGSDIFSRDALINTKFYEYSQPLIEDLLNRVDGQIKKYISNHLEGKKNILLEKSDINLLRDIFDESAKKYTEEIAEWFRAEGYDHFQNQMKEQGEWAGPRELKEVAAYFEVDFKEHSHNFSIYTFNGEIPSEGYSTHEIDILIDRNVIDKDTSDKKLKLRCLTEEELDFKLDAVFNEGAVYDDWQKQEEAKHKIVSDELVELYDLLKDRGIIAPDVNSTQYHYIDDLNAERLLFKLQIFDAKEKFKADWQKAFTQRPVILLSNPRAIHWFYYQPIEMSWDLSALDVTYSQTNDEVLDILLSPSRSTIKRETNDYLGISESSFNGFEDDYPLIPGIPTLADSEKDYLAAEEELWLEHIANFDSQRNNGLTSSSNEFISNAEGLSAEINFENFHQAVKSPQFVDITFEDTTFEEVEGMRTPKDEDDKSENQEAPSCNTFTFFTRSPVISPFSTSPPNDPPMKKRKNLPQNTEIMQAAQQAMDELKAINSDNEIIIKLIESYNLIFNTGCIGKEHSCLLADPLSYEKLHNKSLPLIFPESVPDFARKFKCEIFAQMIEEFRQQLLEHHIWILINIKEDQSANKKELHPFINYLNELNDKASASINDLRNQIIQFKDELFENVDHLFNAHDRLPEIKLFFKTYQAIFATFTPEDCARSLLSLMENDTSKELLPYKELFASIENSGFSSGQEMQDLLSFKSDHLKTHVTIAKAIEAFLLLFKSQIEELNSFLGLTH